MLSQKEKEELGSYVDALRTMRRAIEVKAGFALAQRVRVVDLQATASASADLPTRAYVLLREDGSQVEEFSSTLGAFSETVQLVEEYFVGLVVKDTEHERLAKEFSEALDSLLAELALAIKEVKGAL